VRFAMTALPVPMFGRLNHVSWYVNRKLSVRGNYYLDKLSPLPA
jgi:hypothetical protein